MAALAVLSAVALAAIPAPPSQWYKLPGLNAASGASWVRSYAYSTPPNVVYAGVEGGGVFRSTDGGASWSAFNAGFPNPAATNVRALLTSSTGTTVYAGTDSGVWKSTGGAWEPSGQGSGAGKLNGSVQSLMSLPGNVILAGVASGGVWKSTDGGATWNPPAAGNGMPASETPYGFAGQPADVPAFVLVAAGSGVYRSSDSGATWSLTSDGIPGSASPIQPWVDGSKPNLMYVSTGSNGIYRSINGGVTWAPINTGLGAVRARGFQIFTASEGAHLYAATENGLWEALNTHDAVPPPPRWRQVTQQGLIEVSPPASNVIMWALTAPVIPGTGALGLIAGTQSNGGYFLSFVPPDSPCPLNHTTNVTANCPRISDVTPIVGQTLTALNGAWTGTATIDYAYQWQACSAATANSCAPITGAEETSFVVPNGSTSRYRVVVTATNPAPTFDVVTRTSAITDPTAANPGAYPGSTQVSPPSIAVTPSERQSTPTVGDSMFAEYGTAPNVNSDGWFNPKATSIAYQWLRCNLAGAACDEIPGATARTYVLTADDGAHEMQVRVTGTNVSGSRALTANSSDVISSPAAVADPIPDPDGGAPHSQAPAVAGTAWVGETLAGTVGGWKDPTTEFSRRWVRCDAAGGACTYIQKPASTDPETGAGYVIRPGDVGYTIRLRVTADVNGDISDNGIDDHVPGDVEVDSAPSAVVTTRPVDTGGGGGGGGGSGAGGTADIKAPVLSGLKMTNKRFAVAKGATAVSAAKRKRAPKGTTFRFTTSEAGTALLVIDRLIPGRKVGTACKKPTRKNRKGKRCTRAVRAGTITRAGRPAGAVAVKFSGRIGTRKLSPGAYRATVVVSDAAGNASKPARIAFRIVRR